MAPNTRATPTATAIASLTGVKSISSVITTVTACLP